MSLSVIILIVAAVLSLPGGLFVASLISHPRNRWLALIGALILVALTAAAMDYYTHAAKVTIDAVSWFYAAFLICSLGAGIGALLVDFFTGRGRRSDMAQEF